MALIATPGANNANTYADAAYATTYFASRIGSAEWGTATAEVKEAALLQSATLLDSLFEWTGERATEDQAMRWPREYAEDADGWYFENIEIPENVKKAQCELAIYLVANDGYKGESREVDRLRLGSIMMDFDGSAAALPIPTVVVELLRGLGAYRGSGKSGNISVPTYRV